MINTNEFNKFSFLYVYFSFVIKSYNRFNYYFFKLKWPVYVNIKYTPLYLEGSRVRFIYQ